MLVQYGEYLDIILMSQVPNGIAATLTRNQLSFSGRYTMQLRGTKGDEVRHTNCIDVIIPSSLSGDGQWPTIPSEFTKLEARVKENADRAEAAAIHQPYPNPSTETWWTWDADAGIYRDTGETSAGIQGPPGNILYAVFAVDVSSGNLIMTTPNEYNGPMFSLNNGYLEVNVGG